MKKGIRYEMEDNILYVRLPEELDDLNSQKIKEDTDAFIQEYLLTRIVFDFSYTEFMDSSGIGVLLGRYKRMKTFGADIAVLGVSKRICRMLEIAGILPLLIWID